MAHYMIAWRLRGKTLIEAENVTEALDKVADASPLELAESSDNLEAHIITPTGKEGASFVRCLERRTK